METREELVAAYRRAIECDDLRDERRTRRRLLGTAHQNGGKGMDTRFRIAQDVSGRFIIVNARDDGLAWAGSHWADIETGHPLTFADADAAEAYAAELFADRRPA